MALSILLPPYVLENVHSSDNYFTHYSAADDDGNKYIVTEFFPAYMCSRDESDGIVVSDRFQTEFISAHNKFTDMANALKQMEDPALPRVEAVIEANGTTYAARKVNDNPVLDAYMNGNSMPIDEAYSFIRPLLASLVQASKEAGGMLFNFADEDLHVNRYGQLSLDRLFTWDAKLQTSLTNITALLYRLLVGKSFEKTKEAPSKLGITIHPKLESQIMQILDGGDVLFGSVDDFNKQLRTLMEASGIKRSALLGEDGGKSKQNMLPWLIGGLSGLVALALCLLILFVIVPAYRRAHPPEPETAEQTAEDGAETAAQPETRNYSAVTITNPSDSNDILNGSFLTAEGITYCRAWDNGYRLVRINAAGTETVLAEGVRPAWITLNGNDIYFCDGANTNRVSRAGTDGGAVEVLSEHRASNLCSDGNALYYTNHDDMDRIYRYDLTAKTDTPFIKSAGYDLIPDGGRLYFINGNQDFRVCSAPLNGAEPELTALTELGADNLRMSGGMLFYTDLNEKAIRCITAAGQPVALDCPVSTRSFDVSGNNLAIVEADTWQLYHYDMDTAARRLLTGEQTAYVQIEEGTAYAFDYNDCHITRRLVMR